MHEINWWQLLSLFLLSGVKFLFAPFLGLGYQIPPWLTAIICYTGGLMGTIFFSLLGQKLMALIKYFKPTKKAKLFTPKNRRYIKLWQKFGLPGLAILSPVTISLPVGILLMTRFGTPPQKIFSVMALSLLAWAIILCFGGYALWNQLPDFLKPK